MDELIDMATTRLKRTVEVAALHGGKKFVVVYLNAASGPPPTGDTEEEALQNFIEWFDKNLSP